MSDTLYFVLPCYNEEDVLPITAERLSEKLKALQSDGLVSQQSRIMLVDDGSRDRTWEIISELHGKNPEIFSGLKLARNKGHQSALLAGLMAARELADVVISMDADLQDDINAIDGMLREYADDCDVVYGVRSSRARDSAFKKGTAQSFYKFMSFLGVDIVYNHADYRLMSRRALEGLSQFKEVNLFLRGIVPLIGYKHTTVEYERGERAAGESKYPLKKMLEFALDGVTSFSVKPIRFITILGFLIFAASLVLIIYSIIVKAAGLAVPGWSALMCSIWFLGGLQILAIGIVGEYIGKMYMETKGRPKFIIETLLDNNEME